MIRAISPPTAHQLISLAAILFLTAARAAEHEPARAHVAEPVAAHATEAVAPHAAEPATEPSEEKMETGSLHEIQALLTDTNHTEASHTTKLADTNEAADYLPPSALDQLNYTLSLARFSTSTRDYSAAEKNFERLLASDVPEEMQRTALFEMALMVQAQNDLPRAQTMLAQYLQRWPGEVRSPEVFLHQGQIFRQMGLHNYALSKFYGVMTTALSLKNDQMPAYKRLVLEAQVEIAETHYQMGRYKDAADYYTRLLTQNDVALDRPQIQFRLIRSLSAVQQHDAVTKQAIDFLAHNKNAADEPEVRYYLAQALKGQGRNADALQQVMFFLQEQRMQTQDHPEVWAYWQQRVGNEIGNQLYQDGDFIRALEVYLALSKLDGAPAWQLPVRYQVGITYEKLMQPQLAAAAYQNIAEAVPALGANLSPGLQSVVDMAAWRLKSLQWQERTDRLLPPPEKTPAKTNLDLSQQ